MEPGAKTEDAIVTKITLPLAIDVPLPVRACGRASREGPAPILRPRRPLQPNVQTAARWQYTSRSRFGTAGVDHGHPIPLPPTAIRSTRPLHCV